MWLPVETMQAVLTAILRALGDALVRFRKAGDNSRLLMKERTQGGSRRSKVGEGGAAGAVAGAAGGPDRICQPAHGAG